MPAHTRLARTLLALAAAAGPAAAQVAFTNVTSAAGLAGQTYFSLTAHGLGATWIDVNVDGWPDLFCVNGYGSACHLYLNQGNGSFALRDDLLPPLPLNEKPGAVYADYDNDGDPDLYVLTDNWIADLTSQPPGDPLDGPPNLLLQNRWVELGSTLPPPGQPLFVDVAAAAGVDDLPPAPFPSSTGSNLPGYRAVNACWLDYDRDGWVDLFVGHWTCAAPDSPASWDRLFRNRGDGSFEDATVAAGLPAPGDPKGQRPTLVSIAGHFDRDLWPDLYVGNIYCGNGPQPLGMHQDTFWRNTGLGGFHDATPASAGLGDDAASAMGIALGDVENDGDWDVYITDILDQGTDALPPGNPLYLGQGDGSFQDNSAPAAGVAGDASWPANFLDADDDGDEDLFMGSMKNPVALNRFWLNDGTGAFTDVSVAAGVQDPSKKAYGSAVADYDRDGDLDLLVVNGGFLRLSLLRNDSADGNHWLGVTLVPTASNRTGIGTLVKARVGAQTMMRQVLGGSSAHSQDEPRPHFGLGTATQVDELDVFWPSGLVTHLADVPADQDVTVVEQPQDFAAFGAGCNAAGAYAPSLILSGEAAPGGLMEIAIASAPGGALVHMIVGLPQAPPLALKGCPLHVLPLSIFLLGATSGTADGQGHWSLPALIPPSATPVTAALQAFLAGPAPGAVAGTNGVTLSLGP